MKTLQKGFSLIELMIVIAIIGILAAIAIPSYQSYVIKSKLGELFAAAGSAQLAVAEYLQSSGAANCVSMPIVQNQDGVDTWLSANTGAFPYPNSNLVASVSINSLCNIFVVGQPGQWGSIEADMGQPILVSQANIDADGGVSFSRCDFADTLGNSSFLPIKPNQCIGYSN